MKLTGIIAILLIISGIASAEEKTEQIYKAKIDKDGVQRITMTGGEYFFDPDHIVVKVNVPVELRVRALKGLVPHDIVIKEPEAGMNFRKRFRQKPRIIRFTPTKVGKFSFYCDESFLGITKKYKTHQDKGMEGLIEVVE